MYNRNIFIPQYIDIIVTQFDNISECSNFVEQDVLSDSQFVQYLDYLSDFSEFDIDSVLLKDDENLFHGTLSPLPLQYNLNGPMIDNDVKLQAYLHQYISQRKTLVFDPKGTLKQSANLIIDIIIFVMTK